VYDVLLTGLLCGLSLDSELLSIAELRCILDLPELRLVDVIGNRIPFGRPARRTLKREYTAEREEWRRA